MTPTADYACQSKKCGTPEGAPVYELPIDSTRCPRCGSKRITRLFNKVTILRGSAPDRDPRLSSSSHFARSGALLRAGFDHHDAHKPGYTPPRDEDGYRVDDPMRYDKLKSMAMPVDPVAAAQLGAEPGKGKPLSSAEMRRERLRDPYGPVSSLLKQAGLGVPTQVVGRPKSDE